MTLWENYAREPAAGLEFSCGISRIRIPCECAQGLDFTLPESDVEKNIENRMETGPLTLNPKLLNPKPLIPKPLKP